MSGLNLDSKIWGQHVSIFFLSMPNFSAHRNELINASCRPLENQNFIAMSWKRETIRFKIEQEQPRTYSQLTVVKSNRIFPF